MGDKRYRTYTDEFKREALELLKSSGKNAGQLERGLYLRDLANFRDMCWGVDDNIPS